MEPTQNCMEKQNFATGGSEIEIYGDSQDVPENLIQDPKVSKKSGPRNDPNSDPKSDPENVPKQSPEASKPFVFLVFSPTWPPTKGPLFDPLPVSFPDPTFGQGSNFSHPSLRESLRKCLNP